VGLSNPATWNRYATIPLAALSASPVDQTTGFVDKSIYGGTTFGFLDERLLVLAGWRMTSTESQLTNRLTNLSQAPITARAVTPQYGALYKVTPNLSAFASYAESFVPGSQILNNSDGTTKPAEPTQGSGYDIGLKAELFDGTRFRHADLLRHSQQKHRQRSVLSRSDHRSPEVLQRPEWRAAFARHRAGYDGEADEHWQLYLSYSYMDARIVEFSGNDAPSRAEPGLAECRGQANYKNVNLFHTRPCR